MPGTSVDVIDWACRRDATFVLYAGYALSDFLYFQFNLFYARSERGSPTSVRACVCASRMRGLRFDEVCSK